MRRYKPSLSVKLILICFLIISIVLPLFKIFQNINGVNINKILSSNKFREALFNSFSVSFTATLLTVTLAFIAAYCVFRTCLKHKGAILVLLTLPMLIPSISHGMGLIITFGNNGIFTNLLGLNNNIYGFNGIIIGSIYYSFPVALLMISDMLKNEDSTLYETAKVLGIPNFNKFTSITIPYMRKPMISVFFAVFTMNITDFGVPLMVGGKTITLPVMMYEEVIGQLNFGTGSVIAVVLLFPAVAAFLLDLLNKDRASANYVIKPFTPNSKKSINILSHAICSIIAIAIGLPLFSFMFISVIKKYPKDITFSLDNIYSTFHKGAGNYLLISLTVALFVAFIGVVLVFAAAYLTSRMNSKSSRVLHFISITSLAIPGIVLGLSYVLFFKGSFIYATVAILILANVTHFFASPYLMLYNSLGKINENLEAVGDTLGIKRIMIIKDVILPKCYSAIFEAFSYFFVNSMMTISAVAFLSTSQTKPVSLLIPQFEAQNLLEASAFISFLILSVNIIMKFIIFLVKKCIYRKGII